MKKILVPTDFSPCARIASKLAFKLAKKFNGEVHLLHIINTGLNWVNIPKEKEKEHPDVLDEIGQAKSNLGELTREGKELGIAVHTDIAFDKSHEGIIEHIDQWNHDFLVMGSCGASGLKKVIGTNTQKVIRDIDIPAIIVKNDFDPDNPGRIVFASTFDEIENESMTLLKELSGHLGLKIQLIYVNTPDEFLTTDVIEERIKIWTKRNMIEGEVVMYDALSVEEGIKKHAKKNDIVMLEYHHRSAIGRFFDPSVTESLVTNSEGSVICVPVIEE